MPDQITPGARVRITPAGLLFLATTSVGWGLNWPATKYLLSELPPLTLRGATGIAGAALLAIVVLARGQSLRVERALWPRLCLYAFLNVTCWMALMGIALLWLPAGEASMIAYTMPVWASLLAWPILGERPNVLRIIALLFAFGGLTVILGGEGISITPEKLSGFAMVLSGAFAFALGAVLSKKWPLQLPPMTAAAWQIGLGCLPVGLVGVLVETSHFGAVTPLGWWLLGYSTVIQFCVAYVSWFAALNRLPASVAAIGTTAVPVIGVVASAIALHEPLGLVQIAALMLTLGGIVLATRSWSSAQGKTTVARDAPLGLLFLAIASVGWGLNFPIMKNLLTELPPLSSRGLSGIAGALALAFVVYHRGERLAVPRAMWLRLALVSLLTIGGWVAFMGLALLWLPASEAAVLGISIPVWVALLAWPILGERISIMRAVALTIALAGISVLIAGNGFEASLGKAPGYLCVFAGAVCVGLGTVLTKYFPFAIPPMSFATWQIGLGCLPIAAIGLVFEKANFAALSGPGWLSLAYMTLIQFCVCYVCWFAALQRLPAATASIGTLLVPVVGVLASGAMLHEPIGIREFAALALALGGVALAMRS